MLYHWFDQAISASPYIAQLSSQSKIGTTTANASFLAGNKRYFFPPQKIHGVLSPLQQSNRNSIAQLPSLLARFRRIHVTKWIQVDSSSIKYIAPSSSTVPLEHKLSNLSSSILVIDI